MNDLTRERQIAKLRKDLGEVFLAALADPETVDILLNPDGNLWQERLGEPLCVIGTMTAERADAVMRTLAAYHHIQFDREHPSMECELPLDGSRFAGMIPPIVSSPSFAVRKRASRVFTLQQYVESGIMSTLQLEILCDAIRDHRNILVIGGTGSGKTTLLNSLIQEITTQFPNERMVIIEDTAEIQCAAKDAMLFHTSPEKTMTDLVRSAMRVRPDRILVGEVRGPEALDLLAAWNTGHEGGIASLHANNSVSALSRLSMLVSMNPNAPRDIDALIGEAVDVIVHIERMNGSRKVRDIREVFRFEAATKTYIFGEAV